jgi:hypothetical protein
MIEFTTDINEDLERTQRLPVLTADVPQTMERHVTTEEMLFEVCGALKDTLSNVLGECRTRSLALNCGSAARRALEDSCYRLEQILSAPGFSAPAELAFRSIPVTPGKGLARADGSRPAP